MLLGVLMRVCSQIQDARNHVNQALQLLSSRDESYHFKTGAEVNKVRHQHRYNSVFLFCCDLTTKGTRRVLFLIAVVIQSRLHFFFFYLTRYLVPRKVCIYSVLLQLNSGSGYVPF